MVIPIPGLYTVEKRQLFCHQSKSHILITMPIQLIGLYRPTLNKTDLFQYRFTDTKFYQNPRSSVKSETWTAQTEYDLSITVFSLCTLYIPLLCHFVYSLHTVTMSLCVFSVYHYCVHCVHSVHTTNVFIMCTLLFVLLCILSIPVLCSFWTHWAYPCLACYYIPRIFSFLSGSPCLYFMNNKYVLLWTITYYDIRDLSQTGWCSRKVLDWYSAYNCFESQLGRQPS